MLSERRSGLAESLWRAAFAAWLFAHFATLNPLGALGMLAALILALGWRERAAAALLIVLWWLRTPGAEPWRSDWIVLLLLATHVALPRAPYGSLSARGRADPGGGWSMPSSILRLRFAALFALGLGLRFPVAGIVAGVLALFVPERAFLWAWLALLAAAIWTAVEPGGQGSREFLWLALAANFQPGWFPARAAQGLEWIFYDGTCALCHGFVRFVLAEDVRGECFRFAPLDSAALRNAIPEQRARRACRIRSSCAHATDARWCARPRCCMCSAGSEAGGASWPSSCASSRGRCAISPTRCVAALRKRVFGTKSDACPMLPRHLRARFG